MTEKQIGLVKRTWKIFREIDPDLVGDTFYSKLFNDNPSLRRMFPKNMEQQYRKLIDMLSAIVARLERLHELSNDIAALAQRHSGYGVRPAHYRLVGKALLWTLKQGLGNDWTKDVEEAWTLCYNILSEAMINATARQEKKAS